MAGSRQYLAETITDADYGDDLALIINTPTYARSLLHNLEQAAYGIGFPLNANRTDYKCFKREGTISITGG